ncbi:MAG: putative toxin-antitoxin system toxin component, PIN family [Saprospirales bacterium]|nr:putative toxin-antitoxin system toxin component, PIN family [Saprospirales bacterium]
MRIVLDTNILLTSFSSRSETHWIWTSLAEGKYTLCITHDILLEYEEIIARHASTDLANAVTDALLDLPNVQLITRYFSWNLITADPDDNKFTDCAIAAQARFLVSEDRHFAVLRHIDFPKVELIGVEAFRRELLQTSASS